MKKSLLTGISLLLPLFITIWVISIIFRLILSPFIRLSHYFIMLFENSYPELSSQNMKALLYTLSPVIVIILLLVFITLFGMLMRLYLFDKLASGFQTLLIKMPLFGKVYKFCRDTLKALFGAKEKIFEGGVLVSFPMEDIRCIGLKLTKIPPQFIEKTKKNLIAVLVLTAPHPIAGYLVYYPEDQLKTLNISTESVMRYSVSLGTILN